MLGEKQNRAAQLAVSHYGVNPSCVQRLVQAIRESEARGETLDLLEVLMQDNLITPTQAGEMRKVLQTPLQPPPDEPEILDDIYSAATMPPANLSALEEEDVPTDLRRLGDYRILRRLGEGGMGVVFLAYQDSLKRHVAIKVLAKKYSVNQSAVDRFYREAKTASLLNHPNIVRNYAVGQDKTTKLHYLVMEYVNGHGVDALLEREGKLQVGDAVHIVMDIARALEHAHSRNIVHRDIKPGNILIGQTGLAKLSDMGLAKRTDEASHLTGARQGFGTPYYMPYEQAMNAKNVDGRSDIYALGATFYHLLVGEVPFMGASALEIVEKKSEGKYTPASVANPKVPRILDTILARMMAFEPRHRYQTPSELLVDLERSRLAPPVPSFANRDTAMRDPVVRQRLATAMQSTAMKVNGSDDTPPETPPWFVRYRNGAGHLHKLKMSVGQIVNRFRQGRLPEDVEVSPHASGDFRPLSTYREFQDLLSDMVRTKTPEDAAPKVETDEEPAAPSNVLWWVLAAVLVLTVTAAAVVTYLAF